MDHYYDAPPKYDAKAPEDVQHDAQILVDSYIHTLQYPEGFSPGALPMPFCLPQIGAGFDTPFARGYNQCLHQSGIPMNIFLDFVDGLNMAMISSPPLQVIDKAGMVIGFAPHWTFMLAGALMQTSARVGMHVMSKSLSDRYLRAANDRIFAPLGLRARLCKTSALRALVDHPDARKPEPTKLKKFGQGAGDVILRLPLPIMKKVVRSFMDKPPPIDSRITDPLARRLMTMQGYILPVVYGPPAIPPLSNANADGIMGKMNGFAVERTKNKADKKAQDAADRLQMLNGTPMSREGGMSRGDQGLMRVQSRGEIRKLQNKVEDDARREHRGHENVIWLVILNEADDAKIVGKDAMDNSNDSIAFDDRQLEGTRNKFLKETVEDDYETGDYAVKSRAGGSQSKAYDY